MTGVGGVFIKADDPRGLLRWYEESLGMEPSSAQSVVFTWREADDDAEAHTVWGLFRRDTSYFDPSEVPVMINYRVDDLDAVLARLRAAGADVEDRVEEYDYGRFGWVMDPEGNRIELWEPGEVAPR